MSKKWIAGILLAVAATSAANAQSFSASATCKLTNTEVDVALYEGPCTATQSESGANTIFAIKMGNSEPFLFAGVRGNPTWMHGPERVHFTDLPNGGIFHWDTFALVVAE